MKAGIIGALWRRWRMRRDPVGYARSIGVRTGADCRILGMEPATFGSEPYLIRLGDHVTVTSGVRFVTHDGGVWIFRGEDPDVDVFGPIVVGDNVFIGIDALIMPGVRIGNDSIVAAGSVVTRDVPPGTVVGGVPARPIKTVEDYRRGAASRIVRIRSLPEAERRRRLESIFAAEIAGGSAGASDSKRRAEDS